MKTVQFPIQTWVRIASSVQTWVRIASSVRVFLDRLLIETAHAGSDAYPGLSRAMMTMFLLCALFVSANAQPRRGSITGKIVTDDGAPMSGVTVMLGALTSNPTQRSLKTAVADEEGNFQFANLPPRTYSISVMESRGYVQPPRPANAPQPVYRLGDNAIIRLTRGGVITRWRRRERRRASGAAG
jgi:hypothetical protein